MTVTGERIAAILCSIAALYMGYVAWDFPAGGNQFPVFSCTAIIIVSFLMILRSVLSPDVFKSVYKPSFSIEHAKPLLLTAAVVVYVLLMFELGYYTTSFLFLVIVSYVVGVRNLKTIAVTAIVTFPLMYAFFELFLQARMPRGIFV